MVGFFFHLALGEHIVFLPQELFSKCEFYLLSAVLQQNVCIFDGQSSLRKAVPVAVVRCEQAGTLHPLF